MPHYPQKRRVDSSDRSRHIRVKLAVRQLTDAADPLHRPLVFNFAAQRVAGVGRINDHPALTHNLHRLVNQPRLRVIRMDIKNWLILPLSIFYSAAASQLCQTPSTPAREPELTAKFDPRAGLMKIGSLRRQKTKLHGQGGQLGAFMGRLLTLGHFHGITALLAKVGQQPLQPLGGEIVAPGMGNHRLAARMMNHINRLFYWYHHCGGT